MIACSSALSWMLHDSAGTLLDLGRRRRRPNAALRRAARERDTCRCRFPGCESRRVDLHHIQYWSQGGRTTLDNLVSLCKYHHMLIHDRGYLIAARPRRHLRLLPPGRHDPAKSARPARVGGSIEDCHDADITPGTIIPPWYGERLDLDHAIYICLANARNQAAQQDGRVPPIPHYEQDDHDQPEPFQPRVRATQHARLDSQGGPRACGRLGERPLEPTRPARQPAGASRARLL